jgi:hypothetical protein
VSHTFTPERDARLEGFAGAAIISAAVAAVVVFFPPEGRIEAPVHDALVALLGQDAFLVPIAFIIVGILCLFRISRPDVAVPWRRIGGVALLTLALFPGQKLLGASTGLVGDALASAFVGLIGTPLTVVLLLVLVGAGSALVFRVKLKVPSLAAR